MYLINLIYGGGGRRGVHRNIVAVTLETVPYCRTFLKNYLLPQSAVVAHADYTFAVYNGYELRSLVYV